MAMSYGTFRTENIRRIIFMLRVHQFVLSLHVLYQTAV